MRFCKLSEQVTLFLQLFDEDITQYPQATIINSNGSVTATKNLTAVAGVAGKYSITHVFNVIGDYSIKYAVYSDAGHTTLNNKYQIADEVFRVTALESNIETILNRDYKPPVASFD